MGAGGLGAGGGGAGAGGAGAGGAEADDIGGETASEGPLFPAIPRGKDDVAQAVVSNKERRGR